MPLLFLLYMVHQHNILLATGCDASSLTSRAAVLQLLDALQPSIGVLDKKIVSRDNGLVAYYVSHHEHLILTTNPSLNEAFLDMRSRRPIDQNKLIEVLQKFSQCSFTNIALREFTNNDYRRIECQEPRCTRSATKDYNGLKICADHYEQWQEKESSLRKSTEYN